VQLAAGSDELPLGGLKVELLLVSPGLHQDEAQVAGPHQPVSPAHRPARGARRHSRAGQQQQQHVLETAPDNRYTGSGSTFIFCGSGSTKPMNTGYRYRTETLQI